MTIVKKMWPTPLPQKKKSCDSDIPCHNFASPIFHCTTFPDFDFEKRIHIKIRQIFQIENWGDTSVPRGWWWPNEPSAEIFLEPGLALIQRNRNRILFEIRSQPTEQENRVRASVSLSSIQTPINLCGQAKKQTKRVFFWLI
jgi:hypothetical protein